LFALYFLWLGTHPARARLALSGVALLGAVFSLARQSRVRVSFPRSGLGHDRVADLPRTLLADFCLSQDA
jgi:hypothetical protein